MTLRNTSFALHPLSPAIGANIEGLDLAGKLRTNSVIGVALWRANSSDCVAAKYRGAVVYPLPVRFAHPILSYQ
jgi:hypothetical protein